MRNLNKDYRYAKNASLICFLWFLLLTFLDAFLGIKIALIDGLNLTPLQILFLGMWLFFEMMRMKIVLIKRIEKE